MSSKTNEEIKEVIQDIIQQVYDKHGIAITDVKVDWSSWTDIDGRCKGITAVNIGGDLS